MENTSILKDLILCYHLPNRINRIRLLAVGGIYGLLLTVLSSIVYLIISSSAISHPIILTLFFICVVFATANGVIACSKRIHDLGYPTWWVLLFLILGPILTILLSVLPGNDFANDFGPTPEEATRVEYILAIAWIPSSIIYSIFAFSIFQNAIW